MITKIQVCIQSIKFEEEKNDSLIKTCDILLYSFTVFIRLCKQKNII